MLCKNIWYMKNFKNSLYTPFIPHIEIGTSIISRLYTRYTKSVPKVPGMNSPTRYQRRNFYEILETNTSIPNLYISNFKVVCARIAVC